MNCAVVTIGSSADNILFQDCNIEANLGIEPSDHSGHFDNVWCNPEVTGDSVHDILFRGCHLGVSNGLITGGPLFNVEIWEDHEAGTRTSGFRDFSFENCVFEACHSASLDYSGSARPSDHVTPNSGYSHVTGCTFKGNGAGANPEWANDITVEKGAGFITITGNTFYRGYGGALGSEDTGGHNTFSDNTIDATNDVLDTGITHPWQGYVYLYNDNNVVTGNTITSTGPQPYAIAVGGNDNIITGNTLRGGDIMDEGSRNVTAPNDIN
jgi:hypothetical protein